MQAGFGPSRAVFWFWFDPGWTWLNTVGVFGPFKQAITSDDNWFIRPSVRLRTPFHESFSDWRGSLGGKARRWTGRDHAQMQLSPAWPATVWLLDPILNQIIFSHATFDPLLFYSLAVSRIYCGSGGSVVSHLSRFPERTLRHLLRIRQEEGRMPISRFWHGFTLRAAAPHLPWSCLLSCSMYKEATPSSPGSLWEELVLGCREGAPCWGLLMEIYRLRADLIILNLSMCRVCGLAKQ